MWIVCVSGEERKKLSLHVFASCWLLLHLESGNLKKKCATTIKKIGYKFEYMFPIKNI